MSSTLDLLGEQIAEDVAHLDAAHHRVLTKLRHFNEGGGWYKQGFRSCAQWLSWRVGWTLNTAREHVRVATALATLPAIDRALERGELSYCKVRALTRVATPANESILLEQAKLTTGQQLETICRKYASVAKHDEATTPNDDLQRRYITRRDTDDGMVIIEASLHPEEAALVWAALERVATERCREATPSLVSVNVSAETSAATHSHPSSADAPTNENVSAETSAATRSYPGSADAPKNVSAETSAPSTPSAPQPTASESGAQLDQNILESRRASNEATRRRHVAFDRADAFVHIAQQIVRGNTPDRSPTEIAISIPFESLQCRAAVNIPFDVSSHATASRPPMQPDHAGAEATPVAADTFADATAVACCADGTAISSHAARRLACDAGLVAFIEDAYGNVLATSTKRRTISGSTKRALLHRDQTCRFPGCRTRAFLEGHHLRHWADGGETKLPNMLALCGFHHRFVHEYGFSIELRHDNTVIAHDPNGRVIPELAPAAHVETHDLGWPNIARRNAHLGIHPDTIETWDGNRIDYGLCIDAIIRTEDKFNAALSPFTEHRA